MTSSERRRELRAEYRQRSSEAGVYALRNMATGRLLVVCTTDLAAARGIVFGIRIAETSRPTPVPRGDS
jgi:hypothetical protein